MTDDQRDPAADFQAMMQAAVEAMGRAAQAYIEQLRPVFEAIGKIAADPEVMAALKAAQARQAIRDARPCHCLCGRTHPDDRGVCDMLAVTTRHYDSPTVGPVDVPVCAPCAVAQGVAEMPH